MIDVYLRVHKTEPSCSWQRVLTYKNMKHLQESVEQISNCEDVVKVEVIPIPNRKNKSYNEVIKEYFDCAK